MAYRGYFMYGTAELANTSRVIAHMRGLNPADDAALQAQLPGSCGTLSIGYDDSWSGIPSDSYTLDQAPWVQATRGRSDEAAAREFMGVWVMDVQGLDHSTYSRPVAESLGNGGVAGYARSGSREVTFTALLVGTTNAGARFGLGWLNQILTSPDTYADTSGLAFLPYTPEGSMSMPSMVRAFLPSVTSMPSVTDVTGLGRGRHLQSTVWRVEFTIVFRDPGIYEEPITTTLPLASRTEPVEWVTTGDCSDTAECDAHVIYPAACVDNVPDVIASSPVAPSCVGCMPLCDLKTLTATIPVEEVYTSRDVYVGLEIENGGTGPQSATFHIQYRAPDARASVPNRYAPSFCNRIGEGRINGLGRFDAVVVAPGRRYAAVSDNGGDPIRQVGVITALTGAPYRVPVIDSSAPGEWELTIETPPAAVWTVNVSLYRRIA